MADTELTVAESADSAYEAPTIARLGTLAEMTMGPLKGGDSVDGFGNFGST